jgi:hypothetical protein
MSLILLLQNLESEDAEGSHGKHEKATCEDDEQFYVPVHVFRGPGVVDGNKLVAILQTRQTCNQVHFIFLYFDIVILYFVLL